MADETIDLRSVNWTQGMFLTPDHFLRQERYFDSLLLWVLRHVSDASGLVGGGPRVEQAERGAARFDPIVDFDESGDSVRVTITQCRGITRGGAIVDVDAGRPVSAVFSKRELEGVLDLGVYVVARPHEKEPAGGVVDPINPQIQAGRRLAYTIRLDLQADETDWGLLLTRFRRAERGLKFERIAGFIPPCSLMCSHSGLMDAFRQLNEAVSSIADRYGTLHREMVDYMALARSRGLSVEQDLETLDFVGRMVLTLEQAADAILDPLQPPGRFFQEMTRLIRSSALFLSLSPPTRRYFALLGEIGEVEFVSMLEQEREALATGRRWSVHEDLSLEVQKVRRSLDRLSRLEQALEGKYLDYRFSPSLESLNFVFDRTAGDVLYKSVSKPSRPQAQGQDLTFVFAPLRLESRETYRIVLVGDRQARFSVGDRLAAEVRINPGEGYRQTPDYQVAQFEIDGQRNVAIDFKAPDDVAVINDVRLTMRSAQPIRSAILYVRGRLLTAAAPASPPSPRAAAPAPRYEPAPSRPSGRLKEDEPAPARAPDPPASGPRRRLS